MSQETSSADLTREKAAANRQVLIQQIIRTVGMLPILILLGIAFQLMSGRFFSPQNLSIVTQQASINTVLACGMTAVILTGGIDLSVGSILAASAMVAVIGSLVPDMGMIGIPLALFAGLLFGLINGSLVAFIGLPPFISTLGSLTAVRGVARLLGNDTTVFNSHLPFAFIGNGYIFGIPWLVVIAFLSVIVTWIILRRTVLGVHIYATGGNESAARLSGIKVWAVFLFVYGFSGLRAGRGGVGSVVRLSAPDGPQLRQAYELDAIAAVILGGTSFTGRVGSIWGTLIGALIIAVLSNGLVLIGVSDIWQYIIKGLVIIIAVALDRVRSQGGART